MGSQEMDKEKKLHEVINSFLVSFPFFDTLNRDELAIVADHINIVEIEPDHVLFREGEPGDCVYFVVDGELDVIKESVSGRKVGIDRVVLTTLSKGRSIGEMSVIDKTPRSAMVKARTQATLVSLNADGFDMILEEQPRIGIKILKGIARLLTTNMRKTSSRLADYMLPMS
ncbi:MAG: cyclic nucleotide-binding domain-containing protein [Deltaproteobacteria bacterium]|nr:cyclic nucleotide-binding domain-containing protein [Deltaproteobacteria bacterium]